MEYVFHTFVIYNHIELILRWKRHIIYVDAGWGQLGGCVLNMISDAIPRGSLVTKLSRGIPGGAQRSRIYTDKHHYSQMITQGRS